MKIVTVIGARPQFIKSSGVTRAFKDYGVEEVVINTNQHFDENMSRIFFQQMSIPIPKYNLEVHCLNHGAMTGAMLTKIEEILLLEKPDYVLVYGDTNSTLAGALAASKLHIPIAHVEAGLRSFNMNMPEEINRILTDRVSSYLFCPTELSVVNLQNEGFNRFKNISIVRSGDVMYDNFNYFSSMQIKPHELSSKLNKFTLVTVHRAENTNDIDILNNIITNLNKLHRTIEVVMPIHPRLKKLIKENSLVIEFNTINPVGYLEMIWLLNNCEFVITDSGGLQKESYFAKKKCFTLRDQTEWVELVTSGWNHLISPTSTFYNYDFKLDLPDNYEYCYGNGASCELIVNTLVNS